MPINFSVPAFLRTALHRIQMLALEFMEISKAKGRRKGGKDSIDKLGLCDSPISKLVIKFLACIRDG